LNGINSVKKKDGYVPEFDGLRAVAALGVMVEHYLLFSGLPVLSYVGDRLGRTGVDMFFALSGYLITGILMRCRGLEPTQRVTTTLRQFYARRFLRILPLYYLVVAIFAVVGPIHIRDKLPWLLTYTVNFGKYFSPRGWFPLNHFWTLAVEEQFYIGWPFLILFCTPKTILRVCVIGIAVSPLSRIILSCAGAKPDVIAQLTFSCLEPLALGAAFAVLQAGRRPINRLIRFSILAGGISSLLVLLLSSDAVFSIFSRTAYAFFFAGLVAAIPSYSGAAALRFFRIRPLLYLGRISYGLYVWHVPVIWLTTGELVNLPGFSPGANRVCNFFVMVAMTILISALSWHFFEKPLNSLKRKFSYRVARPTSAG
jgi:peptidoglycan/LPS O-acetylase OafA/YrhL